MGFCDFFVGAEAQFLEVELRGGPRGFGSQGHILEVERKTSWGARVLIFGGQGARAEGEGRVAQGQPVMLVWCNSLQNSFGYI